MFNYQQLCTRDMNREQWQELFRIIRKVGDAPERHDESDIAERVKIKATIDKYTVDGLIGVVESGMDCDCVRYCYGSTHAGLTAIKFQKMRSDQWEWADGPCNLSLCPIDDLPENYSRDLALEAFENGHAHSIHC